MIKYSYNCFISFNVGNVTPLFFVDFPTTPRIIQIKELEDKLQKMTDKFIKNIDKLVEEKSKEILTV